VSGDAYLSKETKVSPPSHASVDLPRHACHHRPQPAILPGAGNADRHSDFTDDRAGHRFGVGIYYAFAAVGCSTA